MHDITEPRIRLSWHTDHPADYIGRSRSLLVQTNPPPSSNDSIDIGYRRDRRTRWGQRLKPPSCVWETSRRRREMRCLTPSMSSLRPVPGMRLR
jgi:hypothetical protein